MLLERTMLQKNDLLLSPLCSKSQIGRRQMSWQGIPRAHWRELRERRVGIDVGVCCSNLHGESVNASEQAATVSFFKAKKPWALTLSDLCFSCDSPWKQLLCYLGSQLLIWMFPNLKTDELVFELIVKMRQTDHIVCSWKEKKGSRSLFLCKKIFSLRSTERKIFSVTHNIIVCYQESHPKSTNSLTVN